MQKGQSVFFQLFERKREREIGIGEREKDREGKKDRAKERWIRVGQDIVEEESKEKGIIKKKERNSKKPQHQLFLSVYMPIFKLNETDTEL